MDNKLQVKLFTEAAQQLAANNSKFNTLLIKVLEVPADYPNLAARLLTIVENYSSGISVETEIESLYAMCAEMVYPDVSDSAFGFTPRKKPAYLNVQDTLSRKWEGRIVRVHHVTILNGSIDYSDFPNYDIMPIRVYKSPTQPITMCRFVQPSERLKSGTVSGTTWKATTLPLPPQEPQRYPLSRSAQPSKKNIVYEAIPWQADSRIAYAVVLHGVIVTTHLYKYRQIKTIIKTISIEYSELNIMQNGDYEKCSPRIAEAKGCIRYLQPEELSKYDLSKA